MSTYNRIAIIDCMMAGISGDMIVGSLLDLGASVTNVVKAMKSAEGHVKGCRDMEVTVEDVTRRGFHAKRVDVRAVEPGEMSIADLTDAISNCMEEQGLSQRARRFASECLRSLLDAEKRVHGENAEGVHLHEIGSVDTVADIVGAATALEDLDLFSAKIYSTPLSVGGGRFEFSHGIVSSPAPATIEILRSKNFPTIGGPVEFELATPTGSSLLVNMVHEVVRFYPPIKPTAIGYGAGARDFTEMPNVLRITLGEPLDRGLSVDGISVIETNLDDATGEIIGHATDRLLKEGARDVSIIPMFTKKNRPGQILKIIADRVDVERLSRVLIDETGTLGVRVYQCERHILDREFISIQISLGDTEEVVNVKVAKDSNGRIVQVKPEYEDVRRIAERAKRPLREVLEMAKMKAMEALLKL
jgi:hypothetical protein